MKDESLGGEIGNWRGVAGRMDDNKKNSSNEDSGGKKVAEGVEKMAGRGGCARQMSMLEEWKRRVAVNHGGRGGGGG